MVPHPRRCTLQLCNLILLLYLVATLQFVTASSSAPKSSRASAYKRHPGERNEHNTNTVTTILSTRCGESKPNKKYTAAAASALKQINSITSKTRQPSLPNISSESALMDKETNVIYWQGGSDIISSSLTKPYLTEKGVLHVRATILSAIIWLWVWGKISRYVVSNYFESPNNSDASSATLLGLGTITFANPLMQKVATVLTPVIQFFLLMVHSLLYLRLPQYSPKFLITTILLYLIEAFSCSTRRYLSHAMNAPSEVEDYLEKIRLATPVVKWKVRCFHYEDRLRGLKELGKKFEDVNEKLHNVIDSTSTSSSKTFGDTPPLWMAKKVVTNEAVGTYKFDSCEDQTVASLWKRSQSSSSSSHDAPFSKLALNKLLVLKDKRAREDYFAQQAAFVTLEGRKDVYAEFATSIEVEGFRPKLLAVRPVRGASKISAVLFRQHIYLLFTLLGLSLPYRIWFGKHCDEVKVTILKETGSGSVVKTEEDKSAEKSSWFRFGRGNSAVGGESQRSQEQFRKNMQSFSLYGEKVSPEVVTEESDSRDETASAEELTSENSELQITQNAKSESGAEEVASIGVVVDEPTTHESARDIDDASPTTNPNSITPPNENISSVQNGVENNNTGGDSKK